MPSYPTFDRNPLDLADDAEPTGKPVAEHVVDELKAAARGSPAKTRTRRRTSPGC